MDLLFRNTTTYNSKKYDKFLQFHEKNFSFSYNLYNIIMIILLLYCMIINIIQKNVQFTILFLAMLAILILIRIYWPIKKYEKNEKQYSNNENSTFTFLFYKYFFTINEETFYYLKLYKVFETDSYFYLYINSDNAILLEKTGFEVGTSEDFSKFIKKKCFLKYKYQA